MKQIEDCLQRAVNGIPYKKSSKWKAIIKKPYLFVFHYHHLILAFDLVHNQYSYEWWEKPADKRGLVSAKEWINENLIKVNKNGAYS